jgi:DNA-binding NarL/FixJ family response regulator
LLADDFPPWREFTRSTLARQAHWQIVGEAQDGLEAIEKAAQTQPDVVLLDVGLPLMSGIDASSRICEVVPGVRVVFLTAHRSSEILHAAFSNGARGYVLKLDAHIELLPAIEAVLRGEKFLSRRVKP